MTALGLAATVRIAHEAKVGPLDPSRTLAYADPADWNPFYDADRGRRFERGAPRPAATGEVLLRESVPAAAGRPAKPIEEHEEHTAAIPSVRSSAAGDKPVIAAAEPSAEPSPAPKPPIDLNPRAANESIASTKTAATVAAAEGAPATIAAKDPAETGHRTGTRARR